MNAILYRTMEEEPDNEKVLRGLNSLANDIHELREKLEEWPGK
ncbi:hypothetical protein ACKUB1_17810 [Methanospirillum stamsii]|nr:hypothetical protein [Methanospirillum stamsii]